MCQACSPGTLTMLRGSAHAPTPGGDVSPGLVRPAAPPRPTGRVLRAEVIFTGGPILTMDRTGRRVESVAVAEGRIVATGAADEIAGLRDTGTRIVELDGRCLLPGLVDPHLHFAFVHFDDWVDVSPMATSSFTAVIDRLREAAAGTGTDGWIQAKQFDPSIITGGRSPTLSELDAVAPDRPLFLLEGNGHVAYVNTRALAEAGISPSTPDPPTARYGRDTDGALTGRLEEAAAFAPFAAAMPTASAQELMARTRRLMDRAASVGCTTLHDCGIGMLAGARDLSLLQAVMAGNPPVRYRGMLVSTEMDRWEELGLEPGFGDDRFRVDGVKAWSDGSNQARTGFQREPYLGGDTRGALNYTPEQLTEVVGRAHRAGWQVGVHANGDAAIDTTIDAYEAVLRQQPRADHRHRIEHCSVLRPDQIGRMAALGLSPSFLIGHVRWWGKAFRDRLLGPERARHYDPCASALRAGLRISLHSDWNVTPLEPLRYVEDAVTRVMDEGGDVLNEDERIPVEAALRAVTIDAAWQCRTDDISGSLEPGKYADLTVLEADPTAVDPSGLAHVAVSETWLGGDRRFGGDRSD